MALFTDKREQERQARHRNFQKTTGLRKTALSLLGYKDTGEKNKFGEYFGHGNVLLDYYAPKAIAQGDTKEVIGASEEEQWGKQMATAKFAMNFVGGGAGGGIGALGGDDQGGNGGLFKGGGASETPNADAMNNISSEGTRSESMNKLDSGYSQQTVDGVTTTNIGGVDLDADSLVKYQEYMANNPDGTMEEFQSLQIKNGESQEGQGLLDIAKSTEAIPILGDLMGAVGSRVPVKRALESKKKEIESRSSTQNFNYL